jgi:hypothetical protein
VLRSAADRTPRSVSRTGDIERVGFHFVQLGIPLREGSVKRVTHVRTKR